MTVEMESPAGGRILAHAGQVENMLARGYVVIPPPPPKKKPGALAESGEASATADRPPRKKRRIEP